VSYQKDYYAILQVPRTASQDQIERAYQRLAALYDPKTSRKNRAEQRFADIQEAYDVLSSRAKRRDHDKTLAKSVATAGSAPPSETVSNRFIMISAGVIIASIVVILAAVLLLADGGGDDGASSTPLITFTPAGPTATPDPTPEGPTPTDAPATAPEITTEPTLTESGLGLIEIEPGTGAQPTINDEVQIWYTGYLAADGTKFDSSVDSGTPAKFQVTGVIDGFTEGLLSMKEGGTTRMLIPAALGYGEAGSGDLIPPNSDLIFDVTLLLVITGPTPTAVPSETPTATPADSVAATTAAADTPTP
jgi:hypothetical protein